MDSTSRPSYRDLDRAALDREYDLRSAAPDHELWGERRIAWSERARQTLDCQLDVRYGESSRQALDIFPAVQRSTGVEVAGVEAGGSAGVEVGGSAGAEGGATGSPVEIYIHGGAWRGKSKADVSFIAEPLVAAGVTFVAIDHDLAPDVTLDEIVRQVRSAVAWVHREIATYGGDPNRIHIAGHSSGAHLAAMALVTPWRDAFGLPDDVIKAACLTSGLFDLEPVRLSFMNEPLGLDEAAVERLSPIRHLPPPTVPIVLSVGGQETAELIRQTRAFEAVLRRANRPVTFVEMPGDHHYSLAVRPGQAGNPLFDAVLASIRAMGGSAT